MNHFISRGYILLIILFGSLLLMASEPVWEHAEYKMYDVRSQLTLYVPFGNLKTTGRVVFVAIEELSALKNKPFIFWYPDLGRFLEIVAKAGATSVGIDIIPVHSLEQKLPEGFKGFEGAPSSALLEDIGKQFDNALVSGLMQASRNTAVIQGVGGSLVPYFYDLMAFMGNVRPASLRVDPDQDGILRRESLNPEKEQEGFVAQLYRASGAKDEIPEQFSVNYSLLEKIPVFPFEGILDGSFDTSKLRGKIIILGMKSSHDDVHDTPIGIHPGALIHATALETLLTGTVMTSPGWLTCFGILTAMSLLILPFIRSRQPFHSFCYTCGLMFVYFIAAVVVFSFGYNLPLFPHILAPPLIFILNYLYRYIVEERSKQQLYKTFSYYVDPQIIDKLVTQDPKSLMKGERRDVCVMFLDIRGFTALSEDISSESCVLMLNLFFGRVSEAVQGNQGFVNKFIGDGMLAFFAVSESFVDDALRASRDICLVTEELNRSGELTPYIGERTIAIGIGLHAGNVILGNIGSHRKLDFTVIGPPVNLASRIESLTKQYGRTVLVSENVQQSASADFTFDHLGRAEIKGIVGGAEIFALQN